MLDARSVAYPGEGASGKYFVSLIEKLDLASEMKSKMRPMPAEYNVEADTLRLDLTNLLVDLREQGLVEICD